MVPGLMGQEDRGRAMIGGPFSLPDGDGRRFMHGDLTGRRHLIYFGSTCQLQKKSTIRAFPLRNMGFSDRSGVRLMFTAGEDKPHA